MLKRKHTSEKKKNGKSNKCGICIDEINEMTNILTLECTNRLGQSRTLESKKLRTNFICFYTYLGSSWAILVVITEPQSPP